MSGRHPTGILSCMSIFSLICTLIFVNYRANEEIDKLRISSKGELAKLEASLKKADIRIAGLEQTVEQKVFCFFRVTSITIRSQVLESQFEVRCLKKHSMPIGHTQLLILFQTKEAAELTAICDELIAKVGH